MSHHDEARQYDVRQEVERKRALRSERLAELKPHLEALEKVINNSRFIGAKPDVQVHSVQKFRELRLLLKELFS